MRSHWLGSGGWPSEIRWNYSGPDEEISGRIPNLSTSATKLEKVVKSMLNYLSQSARSHYISFSPLVLSTALSAHVVGEDDAVMKPSSSRDIVLKIWHSKDGPVLDKPPARVAIIKTVQQASLCGDRKWYFRQHPHWWVEVSWLFLPGSCSFARQSHSRLAPSSILISTRHTERST